VKENEKRKHASLTIVGTKRDFAFTIRETKRRPLQGGRYLGIEEGIVQ
jgi:hypothetical protein